MRSHVYQKAAIDGILAIMLISAIRIGTKRTLVARASRLGNIPARKTVIIVPQTPEKSSKITMILKALLAKFS